MKNSLSIITVGVSLIACSSAATAQSADIPWHTVDGGGVTFATGESHEAGVTVGQHDAGTMASDRFTLRGGFWCARWCAASDDCNDRHVCTCDECIAFACTNAPPLYGNVICDEIVNVFDILCQIDLVEGGGTSDNPACSFSNADIEPCAGNGVINVFDMFAVLDVVGRNIDPCCGTNICCDSAGACGFDTEADCLADGGRFGAGLTSCDPADPCTFVAACCVDSTCSLETGIDCVEAGGIWLFNELSCDPNPCGSAAPAASSSRELARRSISHSAAPVQIKLVPSTDVVQPGGTVEVHVFASGATDVRGYEIKGVPSGLRRGSASLGASIQDRRDSLMNGVESISAIDQTGGRIIVAATVGSVSSAGTGYLGTFTVQVSDDAVGTLQVSLGAGRDQLILGLADGSRQYADVTPATLRITAPIEDL